MPIRSLLLCTCALSCAMAARAEVAMLTPDRDNTLFEDAAGSLSNGAGQYMFSGLTLEPRVRRALMHFHVAGSVPAGATITGATLTLFESRGGSSPYSMALHRATANWGEGASDALQEEGTGIAAEPGDATWLHTFFPGSMWTTPGGDFDSIASSATLIGGFGSYTWPSTPHLVADVQGMLNQPGANFGWILIGQEEGVPPTAKRFNTREHPDPSTWPVLTVQYEVPAVGPAIWGVTVALGLARRPRRMPTPGAECLSLFPLPEPRRAQY